MLVHSLLYYRMDSNIISDIDHLGKELFELQRDYPAANKACNLYREFKDWTGASSYHLQQYEWVEEIAHRLLKNGYVRW
ncbi:hypothetical protein JCM17380_24620 [Desulfosporosinus burensis]